MRKIKFTLSIGFTSARRQEVVEFEPDATDEEINEAYQAWCSRYMDGGWSEVE